MLHLDQVKQLETKVSKAIQLIQSLKEENDSLKIELNTRQNRIEELENIVLVLKNEQATIEAGIVNALNKLSAFEDTVYQVAASSAESASVQEEHCSSEHTCEAGASCSGCCDGEDNEAQENSAPVEHKDEQDSNRMEIF